MWEGFQLLRLRRQGGMGFLQPITEQAVVTRLDEMGVGDPDMRHFFSLAVAVLDTEERKHVQDEREQQQSASQQARAAGARAARREVAGGPRVPMRRHSV